MSQQLKLGQLGSETVSEYGEASPDDLREKQGLAPGRPLATYVRWDVGWGVERETGIEPVPPAWKERHHYPRARLIANPSDSKIGVKPGWK